MLLMLVEIGLTIAAWRRGWKGWALLPVGVGVGVGFLVGLVMGASGASLESVGAIGLLLDLACIGTLIAMVAKPRRKAQRVAGGANMGPENVGAHVGVTASPSYGQASGMICPSCQKTWTDSGSYCRHCGSRLAKMDAATGVNLSVESSLAK